MSVYDDDTQGRLVGGRYALVEVLGRGGMGTVWKGVDTLLDRDVAVKELHLPQGLEQDRLTIRLQRARREARLAAKIRHLNVVAVYDVVDDGRRPWIVMEFVPGRTLADRIAQGPMVLEAAAAICLQVLAALRAAHDVGVVHRDVKPGNILLGVEGSDSRGRVVLADFGIAAAMETDIRLTQTGEFVGSIDYYAPERARNEAPGPASDLWSLGAVLYEAVTGRPPFRRDSPLETIHALIVEDVPAPPVEGPLREVILGLLAKDPEQRMDGEQAERLLLAALALPAAAAATLPSGVMTRVAEIAPTVETPGEGADTEDHDMQDHASVRPPHGRRSPWVMAVAALVAVALLSIGVVALLGNKGSGTERSGTSRPPTASTGAPRSGSSPTAAELPAGYGYHDDAVGFRLALPRGWRRAVNHGQTGASFIDPTGRIAFKIDIDSGADPDPVTNFKVFSHGSLTLKNYRQLRMNPTSFQNRPAATLEFTFTGESGTHYHAMNLGFIDEAGRWTSIGFSSPESSWSESWKIFDIGTKTFSVLNTLQSGIERSSPSN